MTDRLNHTPEEVWAKIATPAKQADIIRGAIHTAIVLGLSPEDAGMVFSSLDEKTANGLAYAFSGVADGETIRRVGLKLSESKTS